MIGIVAYSMNRGESAEHGHGAFYFEVASRDQSEGTSGGAGGGCDTSYICSCGIVVFSYSSASTSKPYGTVTVGLYDNVTVSSACRLCMLLDMMNVVEWSGC